MPVEKINFFCLKETIIIAAIVAQNVAIIVGKKISVGVAESIEALIAIIETGISVRPLAKQRNIICALEALSLSGDLRTEDFP